ncbi:hypothetical protein [Agromyces humi]|uniref:hypothetical protein n=1 Tax=Agromyces humi TaxID=1766800 RepID=UPI00135C2AD6|nr:hypothetical protein [Agromyces humi]
MSNPHQPRGNTVTTADGQTTTNQGAYAAHINTPADTTIPAGRGPCDSCGEPADTDLDGVPYCDDCRGGMCDRCGSDLSDNEGYDGLCGNCADDAACDRCGDVNRAEGSDYCSDCERRFDDLPAGDTITASHANDDFDASVLHVDGYEITGTDDPDAVDGVTVTAYRWEDFHHLDGKITGTLDQNTDKIAAAIAEIAPGWTFEADEGEWENRRLMAPVPPHEDYWSHDLDGFVSWMREHPFTETAAGTFDDGFWDRVAELVNAQP